MDQDIQNVLGELVAELRIRNDLNRESQAQFAQQRQEWLGKSGSTDGVRARTEQRMAEVREQSTAMHAEQLQFRQELLTELRRLNANFEAFLATK